MEPRFHAKTEPLRVVFRLLLIALLSVVVVLALPSTVGTVGPDVPEQGTLILSWPGDVDCNTDVDVIDVTLILQYVVRLRDFGDCMRGADVTCDGSIDVFDALRILRHVAGLPDGTERVCPPLGALPRFQFGEGVPVGDRELIRQAAERSSTYLATNVGITTDTYTIVADSNIEALQLSAADYFGLPADQALDVGTGFNAFFLPTSSGAWVESPDDESRAIIIYHEHFHMLQNALIGLPGFGSDRDEVPVAGPRWLVEGSAAYIQALIFGSFYQLPCDVLGATPPLDSMEDFVGLDASSDGYVLGAMAVKLLVGESDMAFLTDFYRLIGLGTSWTDAFSKVFGRDAETFYSEFAIHRTMRCAGTS